MNRKARTTIRALSTSLILCVSAVVAQDYDIDWHIVDGGGEMRSSGGDYELSGTIGQPDAGEMLGAPYTLTGGFWAVPPCWCMSDMNNDGLRNGLDVQDFVACMVSTGSNCACADVDPGGTLDMDDVAEFVDGLLTGDACP